MADEDRTRRAICMNRHLIEKVDFGTGKTIDRVLCIQLAPLDELFPVSRFSQISGNDGCIRMGCYSPIV